jgi:hypothetical protein
MREQRGWEAWEKHVNEALSLTPTAASGSQWYQKGDGVDPSDSEHAYQVDAKYTVAMSRSLGIKEWTGLRDQAAFAGKKFALPVRIWPERRPGPLDLAVITFEDFVDLVEKAKKWEQHGEECS